MPPEKRRQKNGHELIDTTCQISWNGKELTCETARQNHLDSYNKIVGKKVALTKAINEIYFLKSTGCTNSARNRRRLMRTQIWAEFHKTFGRWN